MRRRNRKDISIIEREAQTKEELTNIVAARLRSVQLVEEAKQLFDYLHGAASWPTTESAFKSIDYIRSALNSAASARLARLQLKAQLNRTKKARKKK